MRSLLLVALSSLAGCNNDLEPEQAAELFARIQADDYRQWARAPGFETRQPSNTAHADRVDIYVNATVDEALRGAPLGAWPVGSLIVKDGFDRDDELELIAVMEKRPDGWFWAEYFDGDSRSSGKPDLCLDCHARGDDYVRSFDLP